MDRVIQQAIAQELTPTFDPGFSEASYGLRPGRSAHHAVYKVREYIKQGYKVAVDMDLSKFFDTVNEDKSKVVATDKSAIPIAMSRKGPWNLSRTLATQAGMTVQWLKKQGVVSIKEMWVNIHYPATAR